MSMLRFAFMLAVAVSVSIGPVPCARADSDYVSLPGWSGTAYRANGWLTYQMKDAYADDGSLRFDSGAPFVLSPRYPQAVSRVALRVKSNSESPTRFLQIAPFRNGIETVPVRVWDDAVDRVPIKGKAYDVVLSFPADDNVDAVRLFLDASGSGTWAVSDVCVFYGPQNAEDDERLRAFAAIAPAPENLRAVDFGLTTLSVEAEVAAEATGCRFRIDRLDGHPLAIVGEEFVSAPALARSDWTISSANAQLEKYVTSTFVDAKTSADGCSMRISQVNAADAVEVVITSPCFPAAAKECSFVCKLTNQTTPCSDRFVILGRSGASSDWSEFGSFAPLTQMSWVTNRFELSADVRQVRLVFSAASDSARACILDSFRIAYGGDETRHPVAPGETVSVTAEGRARLDLENLQTGRYAFSAQAVGSGEMRDSAWTEEQLVDLSWANLTVEAPRSVRVTDAAGRLSVSWDEVPGADHYLVNVTTVGYPPEPVVRDLVVTRASAVVEGIPEVGEYEVTVTAVAPGGKSRAVSVPVPVNVTLGKVGAVTVAAVDGETVSATWEPLAFATGYRVTVFVCEGNPAGGADREWSPVRTFTVERAEAQISQLASAGIYSIRVIPLPGGTEAEAGESEPIDLSALRPRRVSPVSLSALRDAKAYAEDFSSLSAVKSAVEVKSIALPYWQFRVAGAEPKSLTYTATCGTSALGAFVVSDAERTPASYMLATHATGTGEVMTGLAFENDSPQMALDFTLAFDSVQRSFQALPKTQILEYLVTEGATEIDAEGEWAALEISPTSPVTKDTLGPGQSENRVAQGPLSLEGVALRPGQVLIVRWRDETRASSPMTGIDNVRLTFDTRSPVSFRLHLR